MTTVYPQSDFELEISEDDITYTSYSAQAITVTPGGGERPIGSTYVAGRDVPYITTGKRGMMDYTVRVLYTTGASDLYTKVRDYYLNKTQIYLQYSPEGGASGDNVTKIGPGLVSSCPPPSGDAGSGDAMALEFRFIGEDEADSTVP